MENFNTKSIYTLALRTLSLCALLFFFSAFTNSTGTALMYKSNAESKMKLSGYSKLNNWTMGFKSLNSEGSFIIKDGELDRISELKFDILTNIVTNEGEELDSELYTLLTNGEAQKISFKLTRQMVLPIMKKVHLVGDFTFAGETHSVSLYLDYEVDQNKNVKFNGTNTILLSNLITSANKAKLKALKCNDLLTFTLALNLDAKS
ncbi:hypothetical protein FA048_16020 [Pedobacter polaris]|uniref:Lipid/polyisoprenoid-binding YceI-like domain-containing protein n=1 Tax=Pedobacter polaris TaxID=2571273 RepID=A0A4U1CII0_9SPHI|nr:YceI family protein [Pedobacter polaris]TKC06708.1 hypothetical protein FA048_16020 [Pedobacter polaris]